MTFQLLIKIIIILLIFLLILWLINKIFSSFDNTKDKLKDLDIDSGFQKATDEEEESNTNNSFDRIARFFGVNTDEKQDDNRMKFYRAGINDAFSRSLFVFWKYFGWVLGLLFFITIIATAPEDDKTLKWASYGLGLFVALYITFGAELWIENKIKKRKEVLLRSFPDTLDLTLVCVESGLALDAALARVCTELEYAHPEISKELNKTRIELTMLNDREKALNNLASRTDLTAFKSLVASLLQSEKFGTSLNETLRVLANEYRENRMALAEEKAGRLPALMTIPLVTLMLPALFLLIMSPAIIQVLAVF